MIEMTHLEELVRLGKLGKVAEVISKLNSKKIPRSDMARLANLANRAEQCRFTIRMLYPIIHSEGDANVPASPEERIEYADALRRMGLINEALQLLGTVDASQAPSVDLTTAICFFNQWRYAEAIPHLRRLVGAIASAEYLNVIAKVNLAAALVNTENYEEARVLLEEIRTSTLEKRQYLLLGNSLELSAQILIRQQDWSGAESLLGEAENILARENSKYLSWVQKWRAVTSSFQRGSPTSELLACRTQAVANQQWEIQRDCDLYIGVITRDERLLQRVYFGTPYDSYRQRILGLSGGHLDLPDSYLWSAEGNENHNDVFKVLDGVLNNGDVALDQGGLLHQVIVLLSSDFYRPTSIGSIFDHLFTGERYGQLGSSNRVSQLVRRLRRWLEENEVAISILENQGKYRVEPNRGLAIQVARQTDVLLSRENLTWLRVKNQLSRGFFTRIEFEQAANCSPSTAKRLLRWAIGAGQVRSVGAGAQTCYAISA